MGGRRVGRGILTSRTVVGLSALETVGETFKLQRIHSNPFTNTLSSLHSLPTPPLISPHDFLSPQSSPSTVYLLLLSTPPPPHPFPPLCSSFCVPLLFPPSLSTLPLIPLLRTHQQLLWHLGQTTCLASGSFTWNTTEQSAPGHHRSRE